MKDIFMTDHTPVLLSGYSVAIFHIGRKVDSGA